MTHRRGDRDASRWGQVAPPLGWAAPGYGISLPASGMFLQLTPRLHLRRSSSWFDLRAHVHPTGLYKEIPAPLPEAIPKTLIHISHSKIRVHQED
jgi:hypothetical protein